MSSLLPESDRATLRRQLRAARRALSASQQKLATRRLALNLARLPEIRRARRIALYWPMDGEIDPRPLLERLGSARHRFYLPLLTAFPTLTLRFAHWRPGMVLHRNRFGIPEPAGRRWLMAARMDVVLLPLTGFDARGNRLGMGGGFYDRTLAFMRQGRKAPLLVGVAHACQQVARLPAAAWDVPLARIVTDRRRFRPARRQHP
ncbi:MAG: 5-formyltetrahydrofolate cyclo-ligase [Pseudomonadota bacterium]